jgi:hypothetical protein
LSFGVDSRGDAFLFGALGGAVLGGGIGALIGAMTRTDRWEEIPLDRLQVSYTPRHSGRVGVGILIAF